MGDPRHSTVYFCHAVAIQRGMRPCAGCYSGASVLQEAQHSKGTHQRQPVCSRTQHPQSPRHGVYSKKLVSSCLSPLGRCIKLPQTSANRWCLSTSMGRDALCCVLLKTGHSSPKVKMSLCLSCPLPTHWKCSQLASCDAIYALRSQY